MGGVERGGKRDRLTLEVNRFVVKRVEHWCWMESRRMAVWPTTGAPQKSGGQLHG